MGHTPVAIASKFQDDLFNPITQRGLFCVILWLLQVLIVPASTDFKHLTEPLHGKFWMGLMGLCNHEVALRDPMRVEGEGAHDVERELAMPRFEEVKPPRQPGRRDAGAWRAHEGAHGEIVVDD